MCFLQYMNRGILKMLDLFYTFICFMMLGYVVISLIKTRTQFKELNKKQDDWNTYINLNKLGKLLH